MFFDVREFRDCDPGELVDKIAIQVGPGLLEPAFDGLQSAYDLFSTAGAKRRWHDQAVEQHAYRLVDIKPGVASPRGDYIQLPPHPGERTADECMVDLDLWGRIAYIDGTKLAIELAQPFPVAGNSGEAPVG